MTITIELSAAEESRLRAQAGRERRDLETIIHALVRAGLEPIPAQALLDTPVSKEAHARVVALLMQDGLLTTLPTRPGQTMPFYDPSGRRPLCLSRLYWGYGDEPLVAGPP